MGSKKGKGNMKPTSDSRLYYNGRLLFKVSDLKNVVINFPLGGGVSLRYYGKTLESIVDGYAVFKVTDPQYGRTNYFIFWDNDFRDVCKEVRMLWDPYYKPNDLDELTRHIRVSQEPTFIDNVANITVKSGQTFTISRDFYDMVLTANPWGK